MSGFDDYWPTADPDSAQGDGNDLEPPADGTYDVELLDASAFTAKSGAATVKFQLRVVSTVAQGFEWTVLQQFKSQGQANMTKKQCRAVGVNVDQVASLDELDGALKNQLGQYYTVDVKTNGEFRNTYIQDGPVQPDIPIPDVPATAAPVPDDEDIPFLWRPVEVVGQFTTHNPFV